ncbi:MAG: hypothetical protein MI919_20400 [Holophagales bacterium]|nr:hypothetical protein [Holophagales bacterium]
MKPTDPRNPAPFHLRRERRLGRARRAALAIVWTALALLAAVPGASAQAITPPQDWLDGWLIFQNVMHNHQLLRVDHGGNGQVYAEWAEGEDKAYFWKLETSNVTGYFKLRNSLHPQQALQVNPDGRPHAGTGDDDSSLWQIEEYGSSYLLRNRHFPDRRLHVGHNGNGELYAGDAGADTDDAYRFLVHVRGWDGDEIKASYNPSAYYLGNDIVFENRAYGDRLGVHYVLGSQPLAGQGAIGDEAFHWWLESSPVQHFFHVRNRLHPSQSLQAGHNLPAGQTDHFSVFLGCSNDDALRWKLVPSAQQTFYLQNRLHSSQWLRVDSTGQLTGSNKSNQGAQDHEFQWRMIVTPPIDDGLCQ